MVDQELKVEVRGADVVVTLPGTKFMATYHKPIGVALLMAISGTNDPDATVTLGAFRAGAWVAAHERARKLGWIG
jgi:hypothetical protein